MAVVTIPRRDLRSDTWRQTNAATAIAGELADLCFSRRLSALDPQTRTEIMALAHDCVRLAVEDHAAPIESVEPDPMQAWHKLRERLTNQD